MRERAMQDSLFFVTRQILDNLRACYRGKELFECVFGTAGAVVRLDETLMRMAEWLEGNGEDSKHRDMGSCVVWLCVRAGLTRVSTKKDDCDCRECVGRVCELPRAELLCDGAVVRYDDPHHDVPRQSLQPEASVL